MSDARTKLLVVVQVGGRTQEMAYRVVHELKRRLKTGCVPVFSTDGLKNYFYALTAHFGKWEEQGGKKAAWVLLGELLYAKEIKHQRRRKTVEVKRRMLMGEEGEYRKRLKAGGLSGQINTLFVERLNLTTRQNVSKLTRRTWGPAIIPSELEEHLEWWRCYYHYVKYHESLGEKLETPEERKGRRQPKRIRRRTPATPALCRAQRGASVAAGLTNRRWTVGELIRIPLL